MTARARKTTAAKATAATADPDADAGVALPVVSDEMLAYGQAQAQAIELGRRSALGLNEVDDPNA